MIKPIWEYLDKSDVAFALAGLGIVILAFLVCFLLERKMKKKT